MARLAIVQRARTRRVGRKGHITLLADSHAPDDVYAELTREFSEAERVKLTMVLVAINGWNRIAVGFRLVHPMTEGRAAA